MISWVLLAVAVSGLSAEEPAADLQRFSWKGAIGEDAKLVIDNPFGDVRLRYGGDSGEVEIAAVLQQLRPDGVPLEIRTEHRGGALVISVGWAAQGQTQPSPRPESDRSRADLAVFVPGGASVVVDAPIGLVEAKELHADLDLRSRTGDVQVREHHGAVDASTDSGRVEMVLLDGVTDRDQTVTTVTGPIDVWIGAESRHRVTVTTSAAITTDFTMEIEHHDGEEPDKVGRAVIGGGGPAIVLESRRGNISLRRVATSREAED